MKKIGLIFGAILLVLIVNAFLFPDPNHQIDKVSKHENGKKSPEISDNLKTTSNDGTKNETGDNKDITAVKNKRLMDDTASPSTLPSKQIVIDNPLIHLKRVLSEDLSFQKYFPIAESIFEEIRHGIQNGSISREELSLYVKELLRSKNERSLSAGVVLASEIGTMEMLKSIRELYNQSDNRDIQQFILIRVSQFSFEKETSIGHFIQFVENEQHAPFRENLIASIIHAGGSDVVDWLVDNVKNSQDEENHNHWLKVLEQPQSPHSLEALKTIEQETHDEEIIQAAYNSIGAMGNTDATEFLLSKVKGSSNRELERISTALAQTANQKTWSIIKDEFHFGHVVERRVIALRAFAEGYSLLSKNQVLNTLNKIATKYREDFPEELVLEARKLAKELN